MTATQIKNIFIYTGIMLLDNQVLLTSPDYLKEKTIKFFGTLGKSEFIKTPVIKFKFQKLAVVRLGKLSSTASFENKSEVQENHPVTTEGNDFWTNYCKIWSVKNDDYELMNIINFLLTILPPFAVYKKHITLNSFEKYISNIESVEKSDLSYMAHPHLREYFTKNLDLNDRYCKLRILQSI